jgi:hypothetical protein
VLAPPVLAPPVPVLAPPALVPPALVPPLAPPTPPQAPLWQTPLHSVCPTGQAQVLLVHCWPPLQAWLHAPQFKTSFVVSVQVLPHVVSGQAAEQELTPALATQNNPAPQATPHAPQLAVSLVKLTHLPLQLASPAVHEGPGCGTGEAELHAQGRVTTNKQPSRATTSRCMAEP